MLALAVLERCAQMRGTVEMTRTVGMRVGCASTLLRASSVLHDASRDLAAEPWKAATARYPIKLTHRQLTHRRSRKPELPPARKGLVLLILVVRAHVAPISCVGDKEYGPR